MEQLFKDNIYFEKSYINVLFKDKNNLELRFIFNNFENEWKSSCAVISNNYDVEVTKSMEIIYVDYFDEGEYDNMQNNNRFLEYISEINSILNKNIIEKVVISREIKLNKDLFPKSTKKIVIHMLIKDIFNINIDIDDKIVRIYYLYIDNYSSNYAVKIISKNNLFSKYIIKQKIN